MVTGRQVASIAPGKGLKAKVQDAIEIVEGNAHVKAGLGCGKAVATGLLHYWQGVEVEPADGGGVNRPDGLLFFGFEPGAERGDTVLDEIETCALHDVVFIVIARGDDFFGDTEGGAYFSAREFAVFEELDIGGGDPRDSYVGGAPEENGTVGSAGAATTVAESGTDLFLLLLGERLVGSDDETGVCIIFHEAMHERRGGKVGLSGESGDAKRGKAAPEIERVWQALEPDFLGEEDVAWERGLRAGARVAPADELVVFDDVLKAGGVEH